MLVIYGLLAYGIGAMIIAWFVLRGVRVRDQDGTSGRFYGPTGVPVAEAHLLHRVTLRGRPLRFYRSPLIGPDFPWTILRDLVEMVTDGATYSISSEWIYANNPTLAQAIRTSEGSELLLSHWASMELISSLTPDHDERVALIADFRESMAEAYVLQWAGMSREDFLNLCANASRRSHLHAA